MAHYESFSLDDLLAACDRDFAGDEALLARLGGRVRRYGDGGARAEALAAAVSRIFVEETARLPNVRGGRYRAGLWSMTTHQGFGRRTPALPSGRRRGEPLSNGASPCTGRDRSGPTASLCAAAQIAPPHNGYVVNQRLSPGIVSRGDGRILDGLVRGYFALGGAQLQLDVLDRAVLLEARRHPERHRDLVVRISGYSAYFCDLTEAMQDELIARTTHDAD